MNFYYRKIPTKTKTKTPKYNSMLTNEIFINDIQQKKLPNIDNKIKNIEMTITRNSQEINKRIKTIIDHTNKDSQDLIQFKKKCMEKIHQIEKDMHSEFLELDHINNEIWLKIRKLENQSTTNNCIIL